MKAIIAVNNLGFIGLNNTLPWKRCSKDLALFKKLTSSENVRMLSGYNTFQSLPQSVKDRGVTMDYRDNELYYTFFQKNGSLEYDPIPYICIGGKKTYEKYCPFFEELHISHINDNTIGDTLFPDLRNLNPSCTIYNYYYNLDEY